MKKLILVLIFLFLCSSLAFASQYPPKPGPLPKIHHPRGPSGPHWIPCPKGIHPLPLPLPLPTQPHHFNQPWKINTLGTPWLVIIDDDPTWSGVRIIDPQPPGIIILNP